MTLDQDRLLAYVDGELDAAQITELEAALARDTEAAAFVARERALRQRLHAAFAPVLDEPVPERLRQALQGGTVEPKAEPMAAKVPPHRRVAANAPWWAAVAAALVLGVGIGHLMQRQGEGPPSAAPVALAADGTLVAAAALSQALTTRPSGPADAAAAVQVAWTFKDRGGAWCRTFTLPSQALAGLACREGEGWRVQVLARQDEAAATATPGGYRQAASALPPSVLQAVDARIAGSPLDAAAEAAALQRGFAR
jgi:hypothetical protein